MTELRPTEINGYYVSDTGSVYSEKRRKFLTPQVNNCGYQRVYLNGKQYLIHRLVAEAFVDNPDPARYNQVDHINHDRTDNRAANLRWTTGRMNCNNRSIDECVDEIPSDAIVIDIDECVDEIPSDAIVIDSYGAHEFEDLYFYNDLFYRYNGINYKIIRPILQVNGYYSVRVLTADGRRIVISLAKLKRDYGLL